jgi:hypothetical protein
LLEIFRLFSERAEKMKRLVLALAVPVLMLTVVFAADEIKLDGINCVVAGSKPAKADKSVDYKGGKVYFCCGGCPGAFSKDTAKFATKANYQLAATGQAKQEKCPFSGQPCNAENSIKVGTVKVAFCCDDCKAKAEGMAAEKQIEALFNDKTFDASYKVGK